MSWEDRARCRDHPDPELFFPFDEHSNPVPSEQKRLLAAPAKAYCQPCPVRLECLATALKERHRHGIWGGLTDDERQEMVA